MGVGLFGAYTGSPRLQRAYASGCSSPNSYMATTDDSLNTAIDDSSVTCIEIQGTITLSSATPLNVIDAAKWVGSPRESAGLTILGNPTNGTDKIEGDQTNPGSAIRMYIDGNQGLATQDIVLKISDLTFTNLEDSFSGGAVFAVADAQPAGFSIYLTNVDFIGNKALEGQGGAVYVGAKGTGTDVYLGVIQSEFHSNTTSNNAVDTYADGGAIYAWSEYGTAVVEAVSSIFTNNTATSTFATRPSRGGAIAVMSTLGGTAAIVDGQSVFTDNHAIHGSGGVSIGGAIYSDAGVDISANGNVQFADNTSSGDGGAIHSVGPVTVGAGASFERNIATGIDADGGAIFTPSSLTVTGSSTHPVVFADDSASRYGGAVYAYNGGSITSAILEGNTAEWGGAAFSQDIGWTFADSTIRNNDALHTGGGVYAWHGSTAFYRSAIVGNHASYIAGGVGTAGSLTFENSFVGSNSVSGGNAGDGAGIGSIGDVHLRFTTVYDNYSSGGASEVSANSITSVMSVVGNSATENIWEFTGTLDDSYSVSTSDDTQFEGLGSGDVAAGSLGFGSLDGEVPGQLGSTPSPTSVLVLPTTSDGLAPAANPLLGVTRDQLGVTRVSPFTIGARQVATDPNPPAPNPSIPASAPRDVRAEAGVESASVSWLPPASSGSFPVTSYKAVASPGGKTCLVQAPELTCTITGLTPGTPYTVTARALTGAGWSEISTPSSTVAPLSPEVPTILITNSRDRAQKSVTRIEGSTTGLVGAKVVPYLRFAKQGTFRPGNRTRTVDAEGNFVWQRKANKRFTVYFVSGDVKSNRLVIRPA